jgi:hypothetical protein
MTVSYTFTPKENPGNPEALRKFYAQAKSNGELTLRKLSKDISEGSTTVSNIDVLAVYNNLTKMLRRYLSNGEIVRFGSFQVI